ncbi:MAG: hypothetical protein ILA02_01230 [Clostridia bacterium]|nr:hypothetical protein [Clostridia bacterium]
MEDNARCFIRIGKGKFEEITYKELEQRREVRRGYLKKLFIPVQRNANRSY